jgi:hypothetical protein
MSRVVFKSIPEIYDKEKRGIKPNTARFVDDFSDYRFKDLRDGSANEIEIVNTKTNESFVRDIQDITFFYPEDKPTLVIISWRSK